MVRPRPGPPAHPYRLKASLYLIIALAFGAYVFHGLIGESGHLPVVQGGNSFVNLTITSGVPRQGIHLEVRPGGVSNGSQLLPDGDLLVLTQKPMEYPAAYLSVSDNLVPALKACTNEMPLPQGSAAIKQVTGDGDTAGQNVFRVRLNHPVFEKASYATGFDCPLLAGVFSSTDGAYSYFNSPVLSIFIDNLPKKPALPNLCVFVTGPNPPPDLVVQGDTPSPTLKPGSLPADQIDPEVGGSYEWESCKSTKIVQIRQYEEYQLPVSLTYFDAGSQQAADLKALLYGVLLGIAGAFAAMAMDQMLSAWIASPWSSRLWRSMKA
jgi:hypothetical protein